MIKLDAQLYNHAKMFRLIKMIMLRYEIFLAN